MSCKKFMGVHSFFLQNPPSRPSFFARYRGGGFFLLIYRIRFIISNSSLLWVETVRHILKLFTGRCIKGLFCFLAFLFFFGCGEREELQILPLENRIGSTEIALQGVCIAKKKLLTVAHGFPERSANEMRRERNADLLLLKEDRCMSSAPFSEGGSNVGDFLYDCESEEKLGKILGRGPFLAESLFARVSLSNALFTSVAVDEGMSGRPICAEDGEVLSIIGAEHEGQAILHDPKTIRDFLKE